MQVKNKSKISTIDDDLFFELFDFLYKDKIYLHYLNNIHCRTYLPKFNKIKTKEEFKKSLLKVFEKLPESKILYILFTITYLKRRCIIELNNADEQAKIIIGAIEYKLKGMDNNEKNWKS